MKTGIIYCLTFFTVVSLFGRNPFHETVNDSILNYHGSIKIELASFENASLTDVAYLPLKGEQNSQSLLFAGATWNMESEITKVPYKNHCYQIALTAKIREGVAKNVSLGLKTEFDTWSEQNYVLMPGAVYNGNRYRSALKTRRTPIASALERSPGAGPLITNVPRLSIAKEESLLQQLSGDMATPDVGIQFQELNKGFFILTSQGNQYGDYSYKIWENKNHDKASLTVRLPGVREDSVYKGGGREFMASSDKAVDLNPGDEISFSCRIYFFPSADVSSLFKFYTGIRKDFGDDTITNELPLSSAWNLLEVKYNAQNWVREYGYYSVGMRESTYQDWQTGWVGGMNAVYPLLVSGNDVTRERAMQTFDFLFDTISPSGLFYEVFFDGTWQLTSGSSFLRRNSDALYFTLKSFEEIKKHQPDYVFPDKWLSAVKGCADLYLTLWNQNGEFGQAVDFISGEITAPGTSSNGIACAALALCSEFFENDTYLEVAKSAAEYYYMNFVLKGITNGGPGDIYQGMDSESAFGLLESFVVLYEITKDKKWLNYAEDIANQCSSWVVSYNFEFPEGSTFNKMEMKTTGTVIANIQNKHASPGICTLSGNSLFKLYRYTGNLFYLHLIRDIAKTIPQYMSRADRTIPDVRPDAMWPEMPSGWINERVNLSDWEERGSPGDIRRGEIFGGSTWSEAAFMNVYAEIPDIYILKDKMELTVLDNVEAEYQGRDAIQNTNPTRFPANVRIFIETSENLNKILKHGYMKDCEEIQVEPRTSVLYRLNTQ